MGHGLLAGKKGIIFGALDSKSIAWKVAEKCVEEGAVIVLTNAPVAMRLGEINELATKVNAQIVPADATSMEDLENLFSQSMEILGGKIDFVLHSIGMSVNVRKKKDYTDLNDAVWVAVEDDGVGMTPDVVARAHEPYITTKGDAGTGLGLAMVHAAVVRAAGTMDIRSAVGAGTTVTLRFPRA